MAIYIGIKEEESLFKFVPTNLMSLWVSSPAERKQSDLPTR